MQEGPRSNFWPLSAWGMKRWYNIPRTGNCGADLCDITISPPSSWGVELAMRGGVWSAHFCPCFFLSRSSMLPAASRALVACTAPCWAASRCTVRFIQPSPVCVPLQGLLVCQVMSSQKRRPLKLLRCLRSTPSRLPTTAPLRCCFPVFRCHSYKAIVACLYFFLSASLRRIDLSCSCCFFCLLLSPRPGRKPVLHRCLSLPSLPTNAICLAHDNHRSLALRSFGFLDRQSQMRDYNRFLFAAYMDLQHHRGRAMF